MKRQIPYKILFMNDNYYLACETNNEYKFSMYRINNILNNSMDKYILDGI